MTKTTMPLHDQLDRPPWLDVQQWPFALRRHVHQTEGGEPIDIHYTDEGHGPTLVFVHAGMWSFIWRDVITALRSDFRCIAVDFPGAGLSGGSRHDVDIEAFPKILNAVLDQCGVTDACLVLHDLGGMVGVQAAAQRPERVAGLVAANSFSWAPDRAPLRIMLRLMGSHALTWSLGTLRAIPRASRTGSGVGRHLDAEGRAAFFGPYRSRSRSRNFHRAMRSASRATASFAAAEAALAGPLAELPILTIFGEKNDQFGFADRWKSLFPHALQWTVEGGNHFPMCDAPGDFVHQLTDWHRTRVANPAQPSAAHREE